MSALNVRLSSDSPPVNPQPDTVPALIRLRKLEKVYQSGGKELPVLKGIDLDVQAGEFIGIVGKSGAGKTTLMNLMTGVGKVSGGEVWVQETPVHSLPEKKLAPWRGRNLGIIYQSFHLMPSLSLLQNVLLPMDLCGLYRGKESMERGMELLRMVELQDHAHKLPSAISGGQQQRVAIARALANDPQILLADEPTGRLDSVTAEVIFTIFLQLAAQGKTILMVSHDFSLVNQLPRAIVLRDGLLQPVESRNTVPGF